MVTRILRWGNSLGLRIPKGMAKDAHVAEGSEVDVKIQRGCLVVTPIQPPTYQLEELLEKVTPSNRHQEVATDPSVGREAW